MTPTPKLRFIERRTDDLFELEYQTIRVLQQWWATDPECYEDWILKVNGEWRDVPLEEEQA